MLLVAVGLYLTNDFNRAQQHLAVNQQDLAIKGQQSDRFITAVEQLGQEDIDKLSIRLGGIYALEALMRDSSIYRQAAIDVLSAFIRTHAAIWRKPPAVVPPSPADIRAALTS